MKNKLLSLITIIFSISIFSVNIIAKQNSDEPIFWRTYINEEYRFEIKYRSDWEFYEIGEREETNENSRYTGRVIGGVEFTTNGKVYRTRGAYGIRPIGIYVNIDMPLQEYLSKIPKNLMAKTNINGIRAIEIRKNFSSIQFHEFLIDMPQLNGFIRITEYISDFENIRMITSDQKREMLDIFSQMLSTFRIH